MINNLDREVIKSIKNFLFDCDGVIWRQNNLIPGSNELLNVLRKNDKKVFLVTNNSTYSVENYLTKCNDLGLTVEPDEILCSSNVLANYMKSVNFHGKVYVVGAQGISLELSKVGIESFGVGEENRYYRNLGELDEFLDKDVKAVVVGFDQYFNLTKMTIACAYILQRKCQFFATNADAVFPTPIYPIPGTGSMVYAIAMATGVNPVIIGKPYSPMFKVLQDQFSLKAEESIMIGDNLDTDIRFGIEHNMSTLLVLTGVTKREDVPEWNSKTNLLPKFITDSVADLIHFFK